MNRFIPILGLVLFLSGCSILNKSQKPEPDYFVHLKTSMGDMKLRLYNETPQHRDNFLKLVGEGFYDSLLFHRVIPDFMIQGGDPDSRNAPAGKPLGQGGLGYTVPAEFVPTFFHKKGALAAARQADQVNPTKASSSCQFYIVQGRTFNDKQLADMAVQKNEALKEKLFQAYLGREDKYDLFERYQKCVKTRDRYGLKKLHEEVDPIIDEEFTAKGSYEFSPAQLEAYKQVGGAPHLDGDYSVFGEVVEGMEVIDKIAVVQKDRGNRPVKDIYILSATMEKVKVKK